jgi:hypothetical protein
VACPGETQVRDDWPVAAATTPAELAAVEAMLGTAFRAACASQGWPTSPDAVREAVRAVMAAPDRVSLVVPGRDGIGGHATLLTEAHDDPSGRDYVELLDVLVDGDDASTMRAARQALVRHARRLALELDRPLLGHVVHGARPSGHGARVVRSLHDSGWHTVHEYALHPLPAGGAR